MESKELIVSYTKGKWYLQEYTDAYTNIIRCNKGKGFETIFIGYTGQSSSPETRVNARLMAAAPDLLEALQEVIAITDCDHVAWVNAKAAIEKAIGERKGGLPPLPEPILDDDDMKAWEEDKAADRISDKLIAIVKKQLGEPGARSGAWWVRGEYDRLYEQLKANPESRIVCYVDYDGFSRRNGTPPCRDISTVRGKQMEFTARGIGYGGAESWLGEEDKKEAFLKDCVRLNVEWLDETDTPEQLSDAVAFGDWLAIERWQPRINTEWARYETIYSDVSVKTTTELYDIFKNLTRGKEGGV